MHGPHRRADKKKDSQETGITDFTSSGVLSKIGKAAEDYTEGRRAVRDLEILDSRDWRRGGRALASATDEEPNTRGRPKADN